MIADDRGFFKLLVLFAPVFSDARKAAGAGEQGETSSR